MRTFIPERSGGRGSNDDVAGPVLAGCLETGRVACLMALSGKRWCNGRSIKLSGTKRQWKGVALGISPWRGERHGDTAQRHLAPRRPSSAEHGAASLICLGEGATE